MRAILKKRLGLPENKKVKKDGTPEELMAWIEKNKIKTGIPCNITEELRKEYR